MDLERSLRRKIVQATGAGVVAPAAIVAAALAVGIGGGGIRGLGSLGQALRGPEIPVAEASGPSPTPTATENLLARAARLEPATARAARGAAQRQAEERVQARRRARTRGGTRRPRPNRTPAPDATAPPSSPASPSPAPSVPPPQEPSTVRQVGDEVKEVVEPLPIVGEPAGEVVDTIVETADQVLPLRL